MTGYSEHSIQHRIGLILTSQERSANVSANLHPSSNNSVLWTTDFFVSFRVPEIFENRQHSDNNNIKKYRQNYEAVIYKARLTTQFNNNNNTRAPTRPSRFRVHDNMLIMKRLKKMTCRILRVVTDDGN